LQVSVKENFREALCDITDFRLYIRAIPITTAHPFGKRFFEKPFRQNVRGFLSVNNERIPDKYSVTRNNAVDIVQKVNYDWK